MQTPDLAQDVSWPRPGISHKTDDDARGGSDSCVGRIP